MTFCYFLETVCLSLARPSFCFLSPRAGETQNLDQKVITGGFFSPGRPNTYTRVLTMAPQNTSEKSIVFHSDSGGPQFFKRGCVTFKLYFLSTIRVFKMPPQNTSEKSIVFHSYSGGAELLKRGCVELSCFFFLQ